MARFCALALWLAQSQLSVADLPVHCLRHQVVGDWEFTLGAPQAKRSSCGHKRPDDPNAQPHLSLLAASHSPLRTMKLSLQEPSTAVAQDGTKGTWTMIYDEAFEVRIFDSTFLAFSGFEFVQDAKKGKTNVSHCEATQVGWFHDAGRTQWGCYVGKKLGNPVVAAPAQSAPEALVEKTASDDEDSEDDDDDDSDNAVQSSPKEINLASIALQQTGEGRVPTGAGFDKPIKEHWQKSVAQALNFLQLGWKAVAYDLFEGKTPRELNRFAGVRHSRPVPHGGFKSRESMVTDTVPSFLGLRSRTRRSAGPKNFDWQNHANKNWLAPVVNQGDCGSCYTVATVHMLTARNRIAKKDQAQGAFSVSFPLYCSEYNQGCDGGYGFLQSKWSEDVGLIPETCFPLSEGGDSCKAMPNCKMGSTRFRASNHHYVGGYYGASDEQSIRAELFQKGPVVMSFEPKEDFMYYKSGVYKSSPGKIHQEWEQVDHAVLLTGYGEEKGQPYWRLQNSWGDDWGEDGFFRMLRGTDESGCESIVVAAEVVEETNNTVLDDFLAKL